MNTVFFPKSQYPVQVCNHRLGKKMTYTENTDVLPTLVSQYILPMAVSRGIRTSAFLDDITYDVSINYGTNLTEYALTQLNNGNLWPDLYFYIQGNEQGKTYTEEQILQVYETYHLPWFYYHFGRKPNAMAYSIGNTTFKDYLKPLFLGGRNSSYDGATDYGNGLGVPNTYPYTQNRFISKAGTFRWWDEAQPSENYSSKIAEVATKIDETLLNGGWLNNFGHWHNVVYKDIDPSTGETIQGREGHPSISAYEEYFDMLALKNANNEIYFAGYGEAVAYLVYRQLITRAVMYSPFANPSGELAIRLEVDNNLGIDTDLLQVPISVKFSTVGTPLAGKTITSDCNLVSLGGGDYIVEIPYTGRFPYAIIKG